MKTRQSKKDTAKKKQIKQLEGGLYLGMKTGQNKKDTAKKTAKQVIRRRFVQSI